MAIHARGSIAIAGLDGLSVEAFFVCRLLVRVTGCTVYFLGCVFVGGAFYIGVAIDTGEHAAVDRVLEFLWIDMKADALAVHLMG
jgi:hypothetical protein